MTYGRAAAPHIMFDFDTFACNLKGKRDVVVSRRFSLGAE